ncbi:S8 family serine peptidase [Neobacillus novalis]|uniref:S8 family serine peptidase n=1 Tax=Neobacillus novalis TaxID=220687 RepID=A0AA95MKA7_9BACI|nr:S8 family serine peptidase [Neobacillus novalis]WHY85459.1 S8 family serine peptidase [Neobacillus novalis]
MSKKNHNKQRKIATYALASALVLSNFSIVSQASAATTYKPGDLDSKLKQYREYQKAHQSMKTADSKLNSAKASLKATDKVRVIVEVDGQTPVEYATKQGKLFKELAEDTKSSLASKVDSQQKSVKSKITSKGIKIDYKQQYATAFNGFSGEVAYGDVAKLEAIAGVKKVYLANSYNRPVLEPNMKTSHNFIQSRDTWSDSGFKGEGMVVSVIDTGVDPSHRDFKITDTKKDDLTKDGVTKLVKDNSLKGKFYTDKVPYGYNYYDQNNTILDLGPGASMHGMHVAGTVAANGDEAKGGIKGVAPEAQVLAMKVFSNDPLFPSTTSDIYLAAIDDSIKLGADVLNMSLGSTASFYEENSAEDLAIRRATANGIVCAVSAGNSQHLGYGWDDPFAKNPDIGVVGAPGLNPDTISVAAAGNEAYLFQHAITLEGNTNFSAVGKGIDDWNQLVADNGGKFELVSLGAKLGTPEDYAGLDVKGKVVVVPRGSLTFVDKTTNAAAAGAAGIIVWNATNGVPYDNQGGWDAPFMFISKAEGETLNAAIAAGQKNLKVSQIKKSESPEMGRMTDFTSWGTTPSLEMKPEITAPGGNIYSTVNNDKYALMSGTSMAAPHVAGGSALVQEYLQADKRFKDLSVADRTHLAKVLLMNTAKVIDDLGGQPFSPRRQGAGMMQTHSAVTTPVYVVNKSNGEPKVELKDFQSKKFEMTFTAKNVTDKAVTYDVNTKVLTDSFYQYEKDAPDYNALEAGDMKDAKIDAPKTITVPAGKSVDFTVKVDLSKAKIPGYDLEGKKVFRDLKEDIFVEGSVNLKAQGEKTPNLTVPYVGFYGKWDNPSILDGFKDLGEDRFFDVTGMFGANEPVSDMLIDDWFQAPIPEKNVWTISPDGDGWNDDVNAFPSFLRNAAEVQFNILDKDEKLLRRVKTETQVRKNYYNGGRGEVYNYETDRAWDGKVGGKTVKDGLYYYEIKSVIDYAGAKWQSKKVPVLVDLTAPKVEATYDAEKGAVTWNTTEEGSGVEVYGIWVNGVFQDWVDGKATSYVIKNAPEKAVVEILAGDYAQNVSVETAAIGDVEMPLIYLTDGTKDSSGEYVSNTPEAYGAYNTRTVPVKGIVTDDIGLKYVKVAGKEVPLKKDKAGNLTFSTEVTFEKDGLQGIFIEAVDHSNKSFSITRYVYIDTTKGEINVTAPERVDAAVKEITLDVNLKDNHSYLDFFVDDNNVLKKSSDSEVDMQKAISQNVKVTLPLELGENKFTLKLKDIAGNETIKELAIKRANAEPSVWKQENGSWYYYVDSKKATGWVQDAGKWYYLAKDGKMQTGWVKDGNTWYYLNKSGAMATGWLLDGGKWYFLNKSGAMATGWVKDGKTWYYLNKSGAMATGWLLDGGKWYYLNANGAMATGWKYVNGKWYFLNSSGVMAANTTVDGYKLGKDGAWIK